MRFHVFDLVIVDEGFEREVLDYLETLNMHTRRNIFWSCLPVRCGPWITWPPSTGA